MLLGQGSNNTQVRHTLVACPYCQGMGVDVDPHNPEKHRNCGICHGQKVVVIDQECRCGRSLKLYGTGVILKDAVYCCGHKDCVSFFKTKYGVQ